MPWLELDLREDPDEVRFEGDPAELVDARRLLAEITARPSWMADALCKEHPEVTFFVARGEDIRPAKDLCSRCLVRAECQQYALDVDGPLQGVWGGLSERERKRLRRGAGVDEAA